MKIPGPIRAILFDLDGTLRYSRPSYNEAFLGFIAEHGLDGRPEGARSAMRWLLYYWAQSPELLEDLKNHNGHSEEFWANHTRLHLLAYGSSEEQAQLLAPYIRQRYASHYRPENVIMEHAHETLETLHKAGFRLAVVSNRTASFEDELEKLAMLHYFEFCVDAGSVNAWKPEPAIFQAALDRINLPAQEIIYVGDNYYADVLGAELMGMKPVLIDPEGVFPDATCPVIHTLKELPGLLLE